MQNPDDMPQDERLLACMHDLATSRLALAEAMRETAEALRVFARAEAERLLGVAHDESAAARSDMARLDAETTDP